MLVTSFAPDQDDYADLVEKLVAADVDVLYAGGYQGDIGVIARQAKKALPDLKLIGGDSLTNTEFAMIAGSASDGTYLTFGPDVRTFAGAAEVTNAIREEDGYEPEGYTLYAYAALQALAQAIEAAGSVEGKAVADALRDGEFHTVLGPIGFDEKGDVTGVTAFKWYVWEGEDYRQAH